MAYSVTPEIVSHTVENSIREQILDLRILYIQFSNPAGYPPLEHSSRILAERRHDVLVLGTGTLENHNFAFPPHPRIARRTLSFVRRGWQQKWHYVQFVIWTLYWTWRWKPKWIYASDPLSCPAAWLIRRLSNVCVLYHEHDSPSADGPRSLFMKLVFASRQAVAQEAELCVLPQERRLQEFLSMSRRAKPSFCVWNCPRRDEVAAALGAVRQVDPEKQHITLYYHGNLSPHRISPVVVRAVGRLKGLMRLQIAGYETMGHHGYMSQLRALAAEIEKSEIIEFVDTMPRAKLFSVACMAEIGLCLFPRDTDDINVKHMVGASNKVFDYMACGLPLLVSDLPEWISTFVEPGFALACNPDDPDSVEAALRWFLDHPRERREMGRRGQEKILRDWNYEAMFRDVLMRLENG